MSIPPKYAVSKLRSLRLCNHYTTDDYQIALVRKSFFDRKVKGISKNAFGGFSRFADASSSFQYITPYYHFEMGGKLF